MIRIRKCLQMAQEGWERDGNTARLGEVFAFYAMLARHYGAIEEAVRLANQSLQYLSEDNMMWRSMRLGTLGAEMLLLGEFNVARQLFLSGSPLAGSSRALARAGIVLFSRLSIEQMELHQTEVRLRHMLVEAREDEDHDHIADALQGQRLSILDLFGDHFVLLAGQNGGAWYEAAQKVAAHLNIDIAAYRVGPEGDLGDPESHWQAKAGISEKGALLVRPDGFVAWRTKELTADPQQKLEQVLTHLLCLEQGR